MNLFVKTRFLFSIEDILADSDSDFDDKDEDAPPAKKSKQQASFIQEDPESIVDLADVNSIGRITSNLISFYNQK